MVQIFFKTNQNRCVSIKARAVYAFLLHVMRRYTAYGLRTLLTSHIKTSSPKTKFYSILIGAILIKDDFHPNVIIVIPRISSTMRSSHIFILQILNMAGGFISRLIKFVRHLPEFSELSQHDQVALLKVRPGRCDGGTDVCCPCLPFIDNSLHNYTSCTFLQV